MGLIDDLGAGPVGFDTCALVYLIQRHDTYRPVLRPVFAAIAAGQILGVTSELTLCEVLVAPLRAGHQRLAARYEHLLSRGRGLRVAPIDRGILRTAARLRATTAAKTPDAIQLASALAASCSAFVTNDRRLRSLPQLPVLQIDDYVGDTVHEP